MNKFLFAGIDGRSDAKIERDAFGSLIAIRA
jgi:hypothetical protein